MHPLLPPYWYKLEGDDVGSLAFLFGLSEEKLEALFLRAGILKPKGERLQYQRNIVDEMLSLDIHNTKGMEFELCQITDESKQVTRKKMKKKNVYFLRLGSSTSARGWEACKNGAAQVRQNIRPPRASISLSRLLFMECDAVSTILEDYMAGSKASPGSDGRYSGYSSSTSPGPNLLPSVTPGAQTEEPSITLSTSSTPNLDNFVGSRDKGDKKKLEGVLLETVSILAPGRGQSNHSSNFH